MADRPTGPALGEKGPTRDVDAAGIENELLLHAEINRLFVKHADEWVSILQAWWTISGNNPVFAWIALSLFLHPDRPAAPLPDWLRAYLWASASHLGMAIFTLKPSETIELIPQAVGLSKPGGRLINDALTLWDAPALYAHYEDLRGQAPGRAKSAWARNRLREAVPDEFHSDEALNDRLKEGKEVARALLVALGEDATDEAVSKACAGVRQMHDMIASMLEVAPLSVPALADFRSASPAAPGRREALRAALKGKPAPPE